MERPTAELIGKKARALKHCQKLLKMIEDKGEVTVPLNCTGVMLAVTKGDALHYKLKSLKALLEEEIHAMTVTFGGSPNRLRTAVAPVGAMEVSEEERLAIKRQKKREYMREYNRKKREAKLAEKNENS